MLIEEVNRRARAGGCSGGLHTVPSFLFERGHHLPVEARPQIRFREARVTHEPRGQVPLRNKPEPT